MVFFGALFLRHIYVSLRMSDGLLVLPSLLFGVTLYMVGGGILFSTLARFIKRAEAKEVRLKRTALMRHVNAVLRYRRGQASGVIVFDPVHGRSSSEGEIKFCFEFPNS